MTSDLELLFNYANDPDPIIKQVATKLCELHQVSTAGLLNEQETQDIFADLLNFQTFKRRVGSVDRLDSLLDTYQALHLISSRLFDIETIYD